MNKMNRKLFLLLTCTLGLAVTSSFAQNKIVYGVGLGLFQTRLNNVDMSNDKGPGSLGITQNDRIGFSAHLLAAKPISKKISFETGLGISTFRSQFKFNYIEPSLTTYTIAIYYLSVPLLLNYTIPLNKVSSLNVSLGPNVRCLLLGQDNFQETIPNNIDFGNPRKYKRFIVSPQLALGYSFKFNNATKLRLSGNIGIDAQKAMDVNFFGRGFGISDNLSTAYYTYYGFSANYFF